jgi:hypothetical protein
MAGKPAIFFVLFSVVCVIMWTKKTNGGDNIMRARIVLNDSKQPKFIVYGAVILRDMIGHLCSNVSVSKKFDRNEYIVTYNSNDDYFGQDEQSKETLRQYLFGCIDDAKLVYRDLKRYYNTRILFNYGQLLEKEEEGRYIDSKDDIVIALFDVLCNEKTCVSLLNDNELVIWDEYEAEFQKDNFVEDEDLLLIQEDFA